MVPSIAYYISHEPLDSLDIFKSSKRILLNISSLVHQHVYNTNKKLCSKYLIHNLTPSHRAKTTPCVSRSFQVPESCKCFPICPVFSLPTVLFLPTPTNHQFVRVREFSVHIAPSPPPLIPNTPHQSCEQSCQKVSVFGSLGTHTTQIPCAPESTPISTERYTNSIRRPRCCRYGVARSSPPTRNSN